MGKVASRSVKPVKDFNDSVGYKDFNLTPSQLACQDVIKNNTLTFVEGYAGVGKSLAILHYFVQLYLKDKNKKIVVIRTPMESAGADKLGYLPSDLDAKLEPYFQSTKILLEQLLSKQKVECDLNKRIQFKVPNYALGSTLDDSLILIDEGQCLQPMIMKLLLERIGKDSICVVAGDATQIYAKGSRNGMQDAIPRFKPHGEFYHQVGHYQFSVEDVVRSDIVKTVIRAYSA